MWGKFAAQWGAVRAQGDAAGGAWAAAGAADSHARPAPQPDVHVCLTSTRVPARDTPKPHSL